MTIYDNEEKEIIIPSNLGNGGINYESGYNDALDKAETLEVTENGTYEGLYDKVRVKVKGGDTPVPTPVPTPSKEDYIKFESVDGTDVYGYFFNNGCSYEANFEYSYDGENWEPLGENEGIGGTVFYIRGTMPNGTSSRGSVWDEGDNYRFCFFNNEGGEIKVTGNLNSLLGRDRLDETDYTNVCFNGLFYQNNGYTFDFSEFSMPATKLGDYSYCRFFESSTVAGKAPYFYATEVGNYSCYRMYAFTNIETAPSILNFSTMANTQWACYEMFYGCSSLTTPPELPCTTFDGSNRAYEAMFKDCTSLVKAPYLPATIIGSNTYRGMFNGCTSLTSVEAMFNTYDSSSLSSDEDKGWLNGITTTGVFTGSNALTDEQKEDIINNYIPTTWTVSWKDAEKSDYDKGYSDGYSTGESAGEATVRSKIGSIGLSVWVDSGSFSADSFGMEGFSEVEYDATNYGKIKYDEGYAKGESDTKASATELSITQNGTYEGYYNKVTANVEGGGSYDEGYAKGKEDEAAEIKANATALTATENGTYTPTTYYNRVTVNVDTDSYYNNGYSAGEEAKAEEIKNSAESLSVTSNGTYTPTTYYKEVTVGVKGEDLSVTENGTYSGLYGNVSVNVPSKYDEGYSAGESAKATEIANNAESLSVTTNGTYTKGDNYIKEVTVNVSDRYDEGYSKGEEAKASEIASKAESLNVTENGTYTPSTYYNGVTVNVSDRYDEGYSKGASDKEASAKELTVTTNGTYTGLYKKVTVNVDGITNFSEYLYMTASEGDVTVSWTPTEGYGNIYYSTDRLTWTAFGSVTIPANSKIYIAGNVTYWNSTPFVMSGDGKIRVWGTPYSIFGFDNAHTSVVTDNQILASLFENCTNLVDASSLWLGATELALNAYYRMFKGCVNLKKAPTLPATTFNGEAVYFEMFSGCTSLTNAPVLPALTLTDRCYTRMFQNTGITSATISALNLPTDEYASPMGGMFDGCSALNEIRVCATEYREIVFKNWVSGVASTGIFYNVGKAAFTTGVSGIPTGWTVNAFDVLKMTSSGATVIKATSISNIGNMKYSSDGINWNIFDGSTTINAKDGEVYYFTRNATSSYAGFNFSITGDGTVDLAGCISALLGGGTMESYAYSSLFSGCKIKDASQLQLPATTLADGCYDYMFYGCTSLTTAPELPATTLKSGCYDYMFRDCTSLKEVKAYFTNFSASGSFDDWLYNTATNGTFYGNNAMSDENKTTFTSRYLPSTWTAVWEDIA